MNSVSEGNPQIFVYGYIDEEMASEFAKSIAYLKANGFTAVDLHINSKGGDVLDGIAMRTCIRTCGMVVNGYVDGIAASMASVIFFSCANRFMNVYARLMMHEPSGGAFGNAGQIKATLEYVQALKADMQEVYCDCTGMSPEEVQAKFFNGKDNFYTAQQAKDAGLIMDTYDGVEVEIPNDEENNMDSIYMAVQAKMELKFSSNMNEITIPITPELGRMLGVTASADGAAVTAAIKKLHSKANQADVYKQQLQEFKDQHTTNEVTAMLDAAKSNKQITEEQHKKFGEKFAEDPDGLKEVLATMKPFLSITDKLKPKERQDGQRTPEVTALMAKGWNTLMQTGEMGLLKRLDADAYADLFEAKYNRRPE